MPRIPASNIAVSSILALEKKLDVTANNIANVNTDEFKKSRAIFQTGDSTGVSVTITKIDTPGTIQPNGLESSNVFLEEEFVNLITTQHSNTANVQVIKTEAEMQEHLLDVFA
ncbi:MAG TPA: flagellar basal body rod C-terminal domain-containing protein [Anaerolineae bacterium]|nr:flagellar basal body rod C-terminal domain-containing protein [Anaerolineae bacterium]